MGENVELIMQLLLPIFPVETKHITASLGVFEQDEIVYYLHCGVPIFSHISEDLQSFRYITSKFILQGLCKKTEISECFGVSYDSVIRYVNKLEEQGDSGFFANDTRHGYAHKLFGQVLERVQKGLDEGKNNCWLAREEKVSEGAIRYAIKTGKLKKKK